MPWGDASFGRERLGDAGVGTEENTGSTIRDPNPLMKELRRSPGGPLLLIAPLQLKPTFLEKLLRFRVGSSSQ